jgi:hypothetical protein
MSRLVVPSFFNLVFIFIMQLYSFGNQIILNPSKKKLAILPFFPFGVKILFGTKRIRK